VLAEIPSGMMKKYLSQIFSVSGEMYMSRGFKKRIIIQNCALEKQKWSGKRCLYSND
jgi:hypothetical protein